MTSTEPEVTMWESETERCLRCKKPCSTDGSRVFLQCKCTDTQIEKTWVHANVMFSSKSDDHATPQAFFDRLNREFNFTLDVCASVGNRKCERFFTKENDGLRLPWDGVCWMNPPRTHVARWVEKARSESKDNNATVVGLVPAKTDSDWFHDFVFKFAELRFVRGILRPFKGPQLVVVFRPLGMCGVIPSPKTISA